MDEVQIMGVDATHFDNPNEHDVYMFEGLVKNDSTL